MRVLVTGGTGYLGRALVRALATRGHAPVVFARGATQSGLGAAAIDGDVRDRDALASAALVGRLLADHFAGRLPGLIGADRRWSFSYVDDVATGHVLALERGRVGGRYVLGGENAPPLRVFELARDLTGCPLPRRIPYWLATLVARLEETRAALTSRAPLLTRGVVEIFRHEWALDSRVAVAELDYRIRPLEDGVRRTIQELTE